ncbi:LPS export ABC transporter ATP-binding protein [Synechococcus sp. HJ21-Hayes]|uniref:LPS export ABC transporter ATP-binding protein n=1 Tax=unclassified Synechococcus TaxID=2626047 RepID=UPI0020CFA6B8|nr:MULTISPECIES: LPS export ABC transporter ATP-binding protein [unclassified Synechococcus]MCP9831214.1 LPS export ABC transporter ATP-binding protein [Synechococcus sp. JJ3a-Johnson]MCP9852056.1 LPS export ABC transporter ATP-binding protein [Synechococcus sp. HJ21-Hayes]
MSLVLDQVALTIAGRPLVKGVSLSLNPGEVVGLLGPNGAGKTTTFNLVTGLLRPDAGQVLMDGLAIAHLSMPKRARLGIGYLPQEASVFRTLDVRDNLLLALQESGTPRTLWRERVEQLVDEFHLRPFVHRRGFQLSGGERRRCEVARALAVGEQGPRYLLLDEPFAGVDPLAVSDLQGLIGRLRERGMGVLITDHNVRETLAITDRAYILTEGSILASGPSQDMANDPLVRRHYLGEGFRL